MFTLKLSTEKNDPATQNQGVNMARIRLLPDEELDEATREAAQAMDAAGADTSTLRGLANAQEFISAYYQFYFPARQGRSISETMIEMVRLRIARHNDCFT